ncbi:MAG: hypothetical protein PHN52_12480 [candidate division Zixibacteria bacterium]|nr:hypothetical protein [candidate division Zixibacteria bacterium]
MKRKIGLFMAVLFALTLTSQTILALDHDPFDPRYNGDYNKIATKDGEPWIDYKNPNENMNKVYLDKFSWFNTLEFLYFENNWLKIFIPKIFIVKSNNLQGTNNDEASGITDNKSSEQSKSAPSDM